MKATIAPQDVDAVLDYLDTKYPASDRFRYVGLCGDAVVLDIPRDADAVYLKFEFPEMALSK